MISNTRSGEGNLAPDAVGRGVLSRPCTPRSFSCATAPLSATNRVAALSQATTHPDSHARQSLRPGMAERRVARPLRCAAHPIPGSQGFVRSHNGPDVAEIGQLSTAGGMAVPTRGIAMVNRKRGPMRTIP